jgi:hypothetical protein
MSGTKLQSAEFVLFLLNVNLFCGDQKLPLCEIACFTQFDRIGFLGFAEFCCGFGEIDGRNPQAGSGKRQHNGEDEYSDRR